MSTGTQTPNVSHGDFPPPLLPVRRFSVNEYHELARSGMLKSGDPFELLYARAGVANYWIVNLVDRQLEVYTSPSGAADEPDYRAARIFREGESVPFLVAGQEVAQIAVTNLLP